jgi:polyisoprenoid-binding protein YceI
MKRASFLSGIAFFAFIILSQTGAGAVSPTFADRFAGDTKMGESGTYSFDKPHSFIEFKVGHNGLIEVPGFFRDFTGSVDLDSKDVAKSSVQFTAKTTSVDTGVTGRDNHLRTADFFDVAKYPEMTFKSTSVAKKGKGWVLTGDLTIKAETSINRRDFGVNYDAKLPTGLQVVSDQITIVLQIEAARPKDAPKASQGS